MDHYLIDRLQTAVIANVKYEAHNVYVNLTYLSAVFQSPYLLPNALKCSVTLGPPS